ncbi:MAG TPA: PP2C family protein-serine/threonine phosphatase [Acidimicrobiales bacterium]|nr:PP2C family protein-serine/threonine phosphatase [Acidimicrobiales bacterium]
MSGGKEELDLRALLAAVEQTFPVDVVDVLSAELAHTVHARHVALLIANFSGSALVRLSHVENTGREHDGRNERAEPVLLPGTVHEEVVFTQTPRVVERSDDWLVLVPVTERGDAIGVLEVSFGHQPDAEVVSHLIAGAHALAYVLIASRRHTDLFEWAQRDVPFSVAAEIQRRLLPSAYSLEAGPLSLAGWLEPSHDAGGDTFDYSLDREHVYVSVTDAMGHSVDAALLATLTVGTLRNRRRSLASPAEQADAATERLLTHAQPDQFVTGLVMRVRIADGRTEVVNAGHPAPFLVRDGRIVHLEVTVQPPLGVVPTPYRTDHVTLEPGDRLLVITDGYLDRKARRVDIEGVLAASMDRHPRQVVQELARNLLDITGGHLQDDATALCLDWYGPAGIRSASGGASQARATA